MTAALRLERTFAATAEEVFDAWTNPEVLERWWAAAPTWTSPGCEVDLRPGGRYRLSMRDDANGRTHVVGGEFREVDRPRRLVYTWRWEGAPDESVVTVEFQTAGDTTTVVIEHSGLPAEAARAEHERGWNGTLDNLARRVLEREAV
jgi:uncharacterized protein YndB with AHSA1/START domain